MRIRNSTPLFLAIYFSSFVFTYAQVEQYRLEYLTRAQGLSSSEITAVAQDKKGIIWIGTRDGLNRYDGYTIKVYEHVSFDSTSLCDNIITTLFIDSRGDLWIGTESSGLSFYNRDLDNFRNFLPLREDFQSLSAPYVTSIEEDNKGRIWIGTTMGLNLFKPETQSFQRFMRSVLITVKPSTIDSLKKNSVPKNVLNKLSTFIDTKLEAHDFIHQIGEATISSYMKLIIKHARVEHFGSIIKALECDKEDIMWISLENQGIGRMNVNDCDVDIIAPPIVDNDPSKFKVVSLCWHNNELWIGTQQGEIYTYNPGSDSFERIYHDPKSKFVKCIFNDSNNKIWIGNDRGLLHHNISANRMEPVKFSDPNKLLSCDVSAMHEDVQGNIWIATYQGGINVLKRKKAFNQFRFSQVDSSEQVNKTVSTVMEDVDGNIWVGFFTGGIEIIKKDRTRIFLSHGPSPFNLGVGTVHKIFQDTDNNVWVGTYEGGIQRWDKHTQRFTSIEFDGGPNKIKDVRDITEDQQGNIWFAVHGDGIKKLDRRNKLIQHFRTNYADIQNSISSDWVFTIHCDKRDRILVGSVRGLSIYDQRAKKFHTYTKSNSNLSHNRVQVIMNDELARLWVGTPNGLNLFLEEEKEFRVFGTKDGLPNNCINGILPDWKGHLWISTNNGLSKLGLRKLDFKNYYDFDGLPSNEFVMGAFARGKENSMLFGTKNGLTSYNPTEIKDNPFKPQILITDFKLFNQPVPTDQRAGSILSKNIMETKEIELTHDQNMISFEFAAINHIVPMRNLYAYRMEGFEENWNYVGSKREATYTNLKPGKYVFRVKASNNDGIWSDEDASISIVVHPPVWLTTWAIILYFIAGIALLILVRRIIVRRIREKNQIKVNEMKLRFFGNLSHEFRTPLTLIIEPLNQLGRSLNSGSNEQKELYSLIKRNGDRLLKLTNQLLNIYEFDGGCMKLKVIEDEMVGFVNTLINEFRNTANQRNIYFKFVSNVPEAYGWYDSDKVEKILINMVSNAFKYTPDNGCVFVYFSLIEGNHLELVPKQMLKHKKNLQSKYAKITVEDNGKGIDTRMKERIFERFFRIDDKDWFTEGTGLGLYLAKQLAKIHYGDIEVCSELGKGSKFTVWIPINKDAFNDSEIAMNAAQKECSDLIEDIKITDQEKQDAQLNSRALPVMLIVEDNFDVRRYLKMNFQSRYHIVEARDGEQGIKQAMELHPDIIISDIMMPVIDGFQLCTKLKRNEQTKHIPIILLTARVEESFQLRGIQEAGADDYITKPFSIDILGAKVNNCLKYKESLRKKIHFDFKVKPTELHIKSADDVFLQRLIAIIEANLADMDFDVAKLSREFGMSQTNLYRRLHSLVGVPPAQFIKDIRLKRAAQLLKASRYSIVEVSYRVGFNDAKYFSKSFKKKFGVLPSEYNKIAEPETMAHAVGTSV